jgi:hypothetical protein
MAGWADALGSIDWGDVAKKAIPAGIGTYISGQANQKAAQTLADSSDRASQQLIAGNQAGQARLAGVADRTAPAVDYLRTVMADGANLTPGQNQRVMDTRRETGRLMSNRVGGRSATAIASRAAMDLENSIYGANRARADQAAGTLAGQNISAVNAAAGQDINLGSNLARVTSGTGENIANAGLATAKTQAEMVGEAFSPMSALRSIIAEERKGGPSAEERDRNSQGRY